MKEKWGPIKSQSENDLKKIAKDLYNGLIFCDRQCTNEIMSVFMILLFMGPRQPEKPKYPNDPTSTENSRDNAIYDVIQRDADQKKYEEDIRWYRDWETCFPGRVS